MSLTWMALLKQSVQAGGVINLNSKKRILVVDDSPNEVRILMELLKDDYAVVAATTGQKAIDIVLGDNAPDLVLMDVTMEPMDGYEACKEIHEIHRNLPVVFVSANTETSEILKGFEAGGIDYLTKPIDEKVLESKLSLIIKLASEQKNLVNERKQASEMVNTALASAGKMSVLFNFLRSGLKLKDQHELLEKIIQSMQDFSLEGSAQVRGDEVISISTQGEINPLEKELLARSINMEERILQKGTRMIVCFESCSILVRNMPVDDDLAFGELKDNLMLLAEDSHNLNLKIAQEQNLNDRRSVMVAKAIKDSQGALQEFEHYQKVHKENSIKIMDDLMTEVENSYFEMGLTDNQEVQISTIISNKVHEALEHMEGGLQLDSQMKAITESLGEIAKSL